MVSPSATDPDVRTLYQDGSHETYECGTDRCGYTGDTYCQNCGYGAGDNR